MADARSMSISARDLDAITATVMSEVTGVKGGIGNVRGVVDSIIGRAALGPIGGWPSSIQGVVDQKNPKTGTAQYSGIGKAGGWENYSRTAKSMKDEAAVRSLKDAITDRLAEIAASGRVTLAPDFQNIGTVLGSKASASSKKDSRSLAEKNISGPLAAPGGFHTYGITDRAAGVLGRSGIVGPGINVSLSFDQHLAPVMDNLVANVNRQGTPREGLAQPFSGRQVDADYQDYTDVLANEQLGVPDLPGPLIGTNPPEFSLADLGGIPDRSTGSFYGESYPDISRGILHDTDQARGLVGGVNVPDYDPAVGLQPDFSDISRAVFGNEAPRNGIGLGVTGYGPGALGTAAMPAIGDYDPLGAAREAFPDQQAPPVADILNDAFGRSMTSPEPLGAPQTFGNYGNRDVGFPSGGFNTQPNRATDMSLAGLSPVGQGVVGVGYNPAAVAAAAPIGAPSTRGMSFDQMTRGIVGYEDKPVTTTTQVPNPAYADWQEAFNNPKATTQQMYADDLADKIGVNRGNFATPAQVAQYGPAPSKTIDRTTTTTTRSPVYGDVPVGRPVSADLSQAGAGSWTSGLTNQANAINANIMGGTWDAALAAGIADMNANPGSYGYGAGGTTGGGGGMSLGGLGGGFSGALGGGYGPGGQPLGGSENQGGAGYGGNFGGSQGSDPSGRGGLY